MPIFMHKKIYLGGVAFAVPPKYIIEPFYIVYKGRDSALFVVVVILLKRILARA